MQALSALLIAFSSLWAAAHPLSQPQAPTSPPAIEPPPKNNPAGACLIDICGIPERANLHTSKVDKRENELAKKMTGDQPPPFSPKLSKLVEQYIAAEDENTEKVIEVLSQSKPDHSARLEGIPKMIFLMAGLNPKAKKAIKLRTIDEEGKQRKVVDEEASREAMKGIPEEEQTDAIALAQHMHDIRKSTPIFADPTAIEKNPPEWIIHYLYPKDSLQDGIKKELARTHDRVAQLQKSNTPLERMEFFSEISQQQLKTIEKHIKEGSADENEFRQLLTWNSRYSLSDHLFRSPQNPLAKKAGPNTEEIVNSFGGSQNAISKFKRTQEKDREKAMDALKECQIDYFIHNGILPTKMQNEVLAKDIERAKTAVIKMIKDSFPPDSQNLMISSIQNTKFILPKTKLDYEDELGSAFSERIKALKSDSSSIKSLSNTERRNLMAALANFNQEQNPKEPDESESNRFCGAFRYRLVDDYNYTPLGSIKLSLSTATTDEETRLATVMHELGHTLSQTIQENPELKGKFMGVRKCLTDQHTEKPLLEPRLNEDGQFTEEDFADAVAGTARGRHSGKNPWCALMAGDLKTNRYYNNSMLNHNPDSHSSDVFRLLNFEVMKSGKLPTTCEGFLKSTNYKENFRDCLGLAKAQYPTETSTGTRK